MRNNEEVEFRFLREEIKLALKKKRINYKTLAIKLDMSEANIKRQMSSDDCSLSRLNDLCRIAEVSLVDLIGSNYKSPVRQSKMTTIQEEYLAEKFHRRVATAVSDLSMYQVETNLFFSRVA